MKFSQFAVMAAMLIAGAVQAQPDAAAPAAPGSCAEKAIGKNGKALSGAAKNSFMKKCEADNLVAKPSAKPAEPTCESKAIDKNGKALAGAAKTANIKKCEADSAKK